ncbi:MAG: hypothetical protein L6R41_002232 [Letrouitia leprolyta]|nr:MAG: hypothetical protein L6R41_002232 [Letrouitia leprolyta]
MVASPRLPLLCTLWGKCGGEGASGIANETCLEPHIMGYGAASSKRRCRRLVASGRFDVQRRATSDRKLYNARIACRERWLVRRVWAAILHANTFKTDIPPLSPQCSACLSPTTVAHCALCWGSHIPTGQAPRPYSSLPSISRDELCKTAKQIPEARCIVDGFCPSAASVDSSFPPDGNSSEDLQPSGLALIEQIIAELGSDAVGYVGVKPGAGVESSISVTATSMDGGMLGGSTSTSVSAAPVVTNHVSVVSGSPPSNTTSTTSTTSSEGRARGLCGRYYCLGG